MTQAAVAPLERAQKLAEGTATFAVIAAIVIAIGSVAEVAAPGLREIQQGEVTPDWAGALNLFRAVGASTVLALPGFLLAGALLELNAVLDEYGKGQVFTLRASRGVRKAAESALYALAFKILVSPTLYSWITQQGRGFEWHLETFDLGLVAFAAFVMVLGRVLEAAARIKEEHDQIV
jgi:hypothetical protein